MSTIKLVVIGASGVGKTSLRGQYISGRFSNGYRATIGADFITKTLPRPDNPSELVILQIWDTAGQERFSSLSSAFFRGADAAILMFDVNAPHTMEALTKWWSEFRHSAPLADEDMEDFCCVVVGNKTDVAKGGIGWNGNEDETVTEAEALDLLQNLVPPTSSSPSPISDLSLNGHGEHSASDESREEDNGDNSLALTVHTPADLDPPSSSQMPSNSIAINPNQNPSRSQSYSPKHRLSKSRSRSSSHFYGGTMTTSHTTLTVYHTPSSSVFDVYQSARSSPELWSTSTFSSPGTSPSVRQRPITTTSPSTRSESTGSAVTITPSLFARENNSSTGTQSTTPQHYDPFSITPLPPPPDRGPKLFFTSAKTGEGVSDVFEYIARRVVRRWEYEERLEARQMHIREASAAEPVRLGSSERTGGGVCCG
ncbi:ras-domain-containing protein [Tricholoma matsutake]|nr:ras-domain-containing protein [Tricholoma matsutake 945]